MLSLRSLLSIIFISLTIFLSQQWYCNADDHCQLDETPAEMSDEEEIELGKQIDDYLKQEFFLEYDSELCEVINAVMQRLVNVSNRKTLPYVCDIIQSLSINAFSAPGGHIYITYGLLKFAQTEDEVAGIIGHEIAHASLRHASKLYREVSKNFSSQNNTNDTSMALLMINNHIEEFEQDADATGVLFAYKAGFDPNGLPDFLERHLSLIMHKGIFNFSVLSSSLAINARIEHLRKYIETLKEEKKGE